MLNSLNLFDRRFVAVSLMNTSRCPKCRNDYSCNYDLADKFDMDFHVKSNRPFLLPCGHNMCENCVYNNRQNLICNTCLMPIEIRRDSAKQPSNFIVREHFDLNFFLLGELNHWRYYRKDIFANNAFLSISRSNPNKILFENSSSVLKCAECELVSSVGKCRQCKVVFCKRCFDNVHKNSRALKIHTLQYHDVDKNNKMDIMRLIKPYFCKRHQRRSDSYCPKCDFVCCEECAQKDHQYHFYGKLVDFNHNLTEELNITLENVQVVYENLHKGQKDIRISETQLEEYAMKTLEEISNHFIDLHSFLQNEERKIMDTFSNMCQQSQFQLREANSKLNKYQEILKAIRDNLESFQKSEQQNAYLGHILPKYNQQIQQIPSQIEVTKPLYNPFYFEIKHDIRQDIRNSIAYNYKDPNISVKIDNSFYDSIPSFIDTTASMMSALNVTENANISNKTKTRKKMKKNKNSNQNIIANTNAVSSNEVFISNIATMATDVTNHNENLVHITYIKSPENFYVQNTNDMQSIRKLSHTYLCNDIRNCIPKSISVGYYYMAFHATDKQWYRGIIKKILPNDLFKIFLVDFGINMEVSKDNLCNIEEKHMNIPFAAMRCAIFDIMPVGKKWTEMENNLLLELLQNKPARISIIEKINNEMFKIDLHTHLTKSVRDTFLYTGLARERPGQCKFSFTLQVKAKLPTIKLEERISKTIMHVNEILSVTMLHAVGPEEFYVIKNDAIESKKELVRDLNEYYNNELTKIQQIYLGGVQLCCAVKISDVWHRAVIEDIKEKGQLSVHLTDEGRKEIINWRQAYILEERFRKKREFAIHCTLADIEPLQENNYVYTSKAIDDFKQMTKNPHLRMEVVAITPKAFKVALFICKKSLDINIAANMVNNNYGISTGEFSQIVELSKISNNFIKTVSSHQNLSSVVYSDGNQKSSGSGIVVKSMKRTPVIVTHLISPGEFYIQLSSLSSGIKTFHQQIQDSQAKKCGTQQPLSQETREWYKNNHCLVYTKYQSYNNSTHILDEPLVDRREWYRGIITDITYIPGKEQAFSVFLRDIGMTVSSIYSQQLFSIDSQLDRVTNAVYCCHLACIEPAGGKLWSQSAIDCFNHYVMNAETLLVSLKGKHSTERNSLPVYLWSSRIETTDPLAPCITKYLNINRNLIIKGLAHMVEPLNTKEEFDQIEKIELKNGEITLEQWFELFSNNVLLEDMEHKEKGYLCGYTSDSIENNEFCMDNHPLNVYLTEIDFNETTNKKAPPAWLRTNFIKKTIFVGYPTYIDFESIVYLHDVSDKPLLEKVTKKITETYGHSKPPPNDYKYIIGQACVAKYHVDSKYYRGIIKADLNSDLEWGVYFIDYGNVEAVNGQDLRPYAPYPNLPAMANKFIIDGIKPKDGAEKYKENELDQMHILLVTKFVSVRINSSELENEIKRCSMRIGMTDAASEFIERGLAEPNYKQPTLQKVCKSPVDDYAIFSQDNNMDVGDTDTNEKDMVEDIDNDDRYLSSNSINCDENVNVKFNHLNEMFERLSKNADNEPFITKSIPAIETTTTSTAQNKPPPPKKRMFNDNDYTKMMMEMKVFDAAHIKDDLDGGEAFCMNTDNDVYNDTDQDEDEDDGVFELEQSFAMNYWHSTYEDMRIEEDEEINKRLDERALSSEEQDVESEFDVFYPNDTSTVFSHFSGIQCFKPPQLPAAMHHFNCRVISIITPTILQIFPHHTEFRYREMELQHLIKDMVKKSLPPPIKFEPHTLCLACYSKDKVWYRAIIRSYNPNAKTVDVLYVDYLNSETLPLKYIRQCPKELLGWPLRTFRVRLHGIKVNPHIKENEIRMALHQILTKRKLFSVVKKHPNYHSPTGSNHFDNNNLLEIVLYESKELSLKGITVYQSLIENNYFQRF